MFDQVKAHSAAVVLIMCGLDHFCGLVGLFEAAGDDVFPYEIGNYDWYRGRPIEGTEGVISYDRG